MRPTPVSESACLKKSLRWTHGSCDVFEVRWHGPIGVLISFLRLSNPLQHLRVGHCGLSRINDLRYYMSIATQIGVKCRAYTFMAK